MLKHSGDSLLYLVERKIDSGVCMRRDIPNLSDNIHLLGHDGAYQARGLCKNNAL